MLQLNYFLLLSGSFPSGTVAILIKFLCDSFPTHLSPAPKATNLSTRLLSARILAR